MARSHLAKISYIVLACILLTQSSAQTAPDTSPTTLLSADFESRTVAPTSTLPRTANISHTAATFGADICTSTTLSHGLLPTTSAATTHNTPPSLPTPSRPSSFFVSSTANRTITSLRSTNSANGYGRVTATINGVENGTQVTAAPDASIKVGLASSCSSSKAKKYQVTCGPTVVSSTSATWTCQTSTSTFTGCGVVGTTTTTTIIPTFDPLCSSSGCPECTVTALPSPTFQCNDCTTISGVVYHTQQTTLNVDKSAPIRRAEVDPFREDTTTIQKRRIPQPNEFGTYNDFFADMLAQPGTLNVPHRLVRQDPNLSTASALLTRFRDFPNEKIFMSVQGIAGCTSIVVASRQAVYMNHIWEAPTFAKGVVWQHEGQQGVIDVSSTDDVFNAQTQAIDDGDDTPMSGGTPWDGRLAWLPSLRAEITGVFDPDQDGGVQVFTFTPGPHDVRAPTVAKYPRRIANIKAWLDQAFRTNSKVMTYERPNSDDAKDPNKADGKLLFMFDPELADIPSRRMGPNYTPLSCTTMYAGWELWTGFQTDVLHPFTKDFWFNPGGYYEIPFDDPLGPGHMGMQIPRRDSIPSNCVVMSASSVTSTTLVPVTTAPHVTSCTFSLVKPVTVNGQAYPATTVCSCNEGVIAGVNTVYAGSSTYQLQCAVQASSAIIVSTFAWAGPTNTGPITSCALSTTAPSVLNGVMQTPSRVCSCNGGVITSINPVSIGYNSVIVAVSYRLQCAVPTKSIVVGTQIVGSGFNPLTAPSSGENKRAPATTAITGLQTPSSTA